MGAQLARAPLHAPPLPADAAANQIAPNGYAGRPDGCIMGKTGPEWLNPFDENAHVEPGRHCVALADEFDAQVASGVSPADAAAAVDPPEDFDAYTDEPWGSSFRCRRGIRIEGQSGGGRYGQA